MMGSQAFKRANIMGVKDSPRPQFRSEGRKLWKTERAKRFRNWVRARDLGMCRLCGRSGEEVHHINGVDYLPGVLDPNNCILLCQACHQAQHGH